MFQKMGRQITSRKDSDRRRIYKLRFHIYQLNKQIEELKEELGHYRRDKKPLDVSKFVLEEVIYQFGIEEKDMKSKSRKRNIVEARQIYCYLSCKYSNDSLSSIGERISRDHATVMYGRSEISTRLELKSEEKLRQTVLAIETRVKYATDKNM